MDRPDRFWPTFGDYLDWCANQGCSLIEGISRYDGLPHTIIINHRRNMHVTAIDRSRSDVLLDSDIDYFSRRLGFSLPFLRPG